MHALMRLIHEISTVKFNKISDPYKVTNMLFRLAQGLLALHSKQARFLSEALLATAFTFPISFIYF